MGLAGHCIQTSIADFSDLHWPVRLECLDDLGLRLADAKVLLARMQTVIVAGQIERGGEARKNRRCG